MSDDAKHIYGGRYIGDALMVAMLAQDRATIQAIGEHLAAHNADPWRAAALALYVANADTYEEREGVTGEIMARRFELELFGNG